MTISLEKGQYVWIRSKYLKTSFNKGNTSSPLISKLINLNIPYILGKILSVPTVADTNKTPCAEIEIVNTKNEESTDVIICDFNHFFIASSEDIFSRYADNTEISLLNSANLLHNIKSRFQNREIYTTSGNVLLAVNPYQDIPDLYSNDTIKKYSQLYTGFQKILCTNTQQNSTSNPQNLPPHPYKITMNAFNRFCRTKGKKSEAIIMTGESGAGKTETNKIIVNFLAEILNEKEYLSDSNTTLSHKIVHINPILESFGNAQTVYNNNSSRFGKYTKIYFKRNYEDKTTSTNRTNTSISFTLSHCVIVPFLMESGRTTFHNRHERNFHIFYQLIAAIDDAKMADKLITKKLLSREIIDDILTNLSLDILKEGQSRRRWVSFVENDRDPSSSPSESSPYDFEDLKHFKSLLKGLIEVVGYSASELSDLLKILCGLLYLGDLKCGTNHDEPEPALITEMASPAYSARAILLNKAVLEKGAQLLGIDCDALEKCILYRRVHMTKNEVIEVPRNKSDVLGVTSSLIKMVYKRLFLHVIERINLSLGNKNNVSNHVSSSHIGLLDIYGFEKLEKNSFEQLCINLTNEKLQDHFSESVLRSEQDLYANEGISHLWKNFDLPDSSLVFRACRLCLDNLDDICVRLSRDLIKRNTINTRDSGKPSLYQLEESLVQSIFRSKKIEECSSVLFLPKRKYVKNQANQSIIPSFIIKHYAGEVEYEVDSWTEKNNDRLVPDIEKLLSESLNKTISRLSSCSQSDARPGEKFTSVRGKFNSELATFFNDINSDRCNVDYIRCFNPNRSRSPKEFNDLHVLHQLEQTGSIVHVEMYQKGWPHRSPINSIFEKFQKIIQKLKMKKTDSFRSFQSTMENAINRFRPREFVEFVCRGICGLVENEDFVIGTKLVFFKAGVVDKISFILDEDSTELSNLAIEQLSKYYRVFVLRKVKRVFHAICLVNWLSKYQMLVRKNKFWALFISKMYTFVIIRSCAQRWLYRVRSRLNKTTPQVENTSPKNTTIRKSSSENFKDIDDGESQNFPYSEIFPLTPQFNDVSIVFDGKSLFLTDMMNVWCINVYRSRLEEPSDTTNEELLVTSISQHYQNASVFTSADLSGRVFVWRICQDEENQYKIRLISFIGGLNAYSVCQLSFLSTTRQIAILFAVGNSIYKISVISLGESVFDYEVGESYTLPISNTSGDYRLSFLPAPLNLLCLYGKGCESCFFHLSLTGDKLKELVYLKDRSTTQMDHQVEFNGFAKQTDKVGRLSDISDISCVGMMKKPVNILKQPLLDYQLLIGTSKGSVYRVFLYRHVLNSGVNLKRVLCIEHLTDLKEAQGTVSISSPSDSTVISLSPSGNIYEIEVKNKAKPTLWKTSFSSSIGTCHFTHMARADAGDSKRFYILDMASRNLIQQNIETPDEYPDTIGIP